MTLPGSTTLDETIIAAPQLALPPQRRLMIFLLLALAILLHVVTNGWGPIENGPDGMNAAISRALALRHEPAEIAELWGEKILPTPVQRLTAQSFEIFGINEFAARLPLGVASVFVVWLVFLTAEKLGGMWRGLACGIIAATTNGAILHGRDGGGATITAGVFCLGLYAAIRMLEQNSRIAWQCLFWATVAGLLYLRQPLPAALLVLAVNLSAASFREARIRLRMPWFYLAAAVFLGMLILGVRASVFDPTPWQSPALSTGQHLLWQFFPWSIVVLPPAFLRLGKIIRLKTFSPAETVFWSLCPGLFIWALVTPPGLLWPNADACLWPIFALLAGLIWERITSGQRILGISILIVLALGALRFCSSVAGNEWANLLQPIWWMSCGVMVAFGISAIISVKLRHSRAALLTLAAAAIPLAFNLLDARVRYNWAATMKDLGRRVEMNYQPTSRVFITQDLSAVSSFLFYAPHDLQVRKLGDALEKAPATGDYLLFPRKETRHFPAVENIGSNRTHILSLFETR